MSWSFRGVLKEYKKIKEERLSKEENKLAKEPHDGLKDVILQKETAISDDVIRKVLERHWKAGTTAGEKDESVEGESQGVVKLTGHPDAVLRVADVKKDNTQTEEDTADKEKEGRDKEQEGRDKEMNNVVANLFEITVDNNGGEKNIAGIRLLQIYRRKRRYLSFLCHAR
jgi:hypothetical protein